MIVVDSSIWIDHFNNPVSKGAVALAEILEQGKTIAVHPLILTEVLMGFKDEREYRMAKEALMLVPKITSTVESHIKAAELYRLGRKRGLTIRGPADCIIAQACIDSGGALLTRDKDFQGIAQVTSLTLIRIH